MDELKAIVLELIINLFNEKHIDLVVLTQMGVLDASIDILTDNL